MVPEEATAELPCVCFKYTYCLPIFMMRWILQPEPICSSCWPLRNGPSLFVVSRESNLHGCHCKFISQATVVMMTLSHVSDEEEKVVFHLNGGEKMLG